MDLPVVNVDITAELLTIVLVIWSWFRI